MYIWCNKIKKNNHISQIISVIEYTFKILIQAIAVYIIKNYDTKVMPALR